jgi:hypothetical protein
MVTSDIIAVVVMISCVVLGLLGTFKWLVRFLAGALLGFLILACVALLVERPKFDELSNGVFKRGVVIPCIRKQVSNLGEIISIDKQ